MKNVLLVDGNSLLYRAFYALPPLSTREGFQTNAIHGFLNMLFKLTDELEPEYLGVFFDVKGKTLRNAWYGEYKAQRAPMPDELRLQVPAMKEILDSLGIHRQELDEYEADDLIGTAKNYFEKEGIRVSILTGDRDLLQLVKGNTKAFITLRGTSDMEVYDEEAVQRMMGYTPEQVIEYKGLRGDPSDNIPGVPGVGEKTAKDLLAKYKTIEEVYEHLEELPTRARNALRDQQEMAVLSRRLATILTDAPIHLDKEDFIYHREIDDVKVLKKYELNSLIARLQPEAPVVTFAYTDEIQDINLSKPYVYEELSYQEDYLYGFRQGEKMVILEEEIEHKSPIVGFDVKRILLRRLKEGKRPVRVQDDVMLMEYLMHPDRSVQSLEEVDRYGILPGVSSLLKNQKIPFEQAKGALKDILSKRLVVIDRLHKELIPQIQHRKLEGVYYQIELPLVKVLASMENEGFKVDVDFLQRFDEEITKRLEEAEQLIYDLSGEEFNMNSPKQLGVVLFEKLKLPVIKKTKTGYSTNKEVLDKLLGRHPVIEAILDYRSVSKLKSTYVDGLRQVIQEDEKIHSSLNQTIAATGRLSSTEPNLQNIPIRLEEGRRVRKMFVPSDENHILVAADYSQIELRVLAHISGDKHMIEGFVNGDDVHRMTASKVFGVPMEEVTPSQRREAKAVNFGIVYGMSDYGLSENLSIPLKEAKDYIEKYFQEYPGVKKYMDDIVASCEEKGYVTTLSGRIREFPEIHSKNFHMRNYARRAAINTPIQGSAADIIKIAMIRVYNRLEEEGLKSKLILQVHDELIIDTCKDEKEKVKKLLKEEMEGAFTLQVPLTVSLEEGENWYEI